MPRRVLFRWECADHERQADVRMLDQPVWEREPITMVFVLVAERRKRYRRCRPAGRPFGASQFGLVAERD
ncbi:hypothetical protein BVRB_032570 [Beta vulgaris subsp. vulgaris]|uniref:Uncharacterized protein n=1 Tax=Beta vulgaris subsp. vulgaris TaxID=3555 RepID=A0A0J8DRH1_BETVV|nr:hypothetical protein BVRB_032570 [Beta vulgaris subsp. vulgaris]